MEQKLSALLPGEGGYIQTVAHGILTERLRDLGFTPGTYIETAFVSPLGDPVAYQLRGTLIALRRSDAALVTVQRKEAD